MLALVLLLSTAWSQALQDNPSGQNPGSTPDPNTIQGCLQIDNGEYTLTDSTGTVHRIAGSGKKLKPHVGHEVELTGKPSWRTLDTTLAGGASSAKTQYVFDVKSVKPIADNCKTY